jgi:hypothetical protein
MKRYLPTACGQDECSPGSASAADAATGPCGTTLVIEVATALELHLESAERQLLALAEQVAAMRRGPSHAALGNLAVDAELAAMGLSHTLGAVFGLAADAMCAEQDRNVVPFRRSAPATNNQYSQGDL